MQRRVVRFLLLIVALATVASACSPAAVEARLIPTSGGGSYRPPPPQLPGEFHRLGTSDHPGVDADRAKATLSRSGRYVYWVNYQQDGPNQVWFADLSTGQSQLVYQSTGGGIQHLISSPRVGDEAKVYFAAYDGVDPCSAGCTWSPTAGLYVAPVDTPADCPPSLWPDENTLILQCEDPLGVATDRLRYDLLTGEITNDELEDGGQFEGLYLHSTSPNGRYQLFISDILVAPAAKVKDTTTGTVTPVAVSGSSIMLMLFPNWWSVSAAGPLAFVDFYGVTDQGEVVYDKDVWHRSLRTAEVRLWNTVTHTDSILPGYDAVSLARWGEGSWMVDYDMWNEIGRNNYAEGREPDQYYELSNKTDPSQRYGLPAEVWVRGVAPDGRILVTSETPLNPGDPEGVGIYYHDAPG